MIDRRQLLAGSAALLAADMARGAPPDRSFPAGFLWGAATAGHQVEGNNVNADDWVLENVPGTIWAEPSGDAANSFALWPTDLDLARRMGLNSYRFSLEWSRIEPEPGHFSAAMLDHYAAMIDGCLARGLKPVVTFNHFTTPRWFAARGGWGDAGSVALFERFCDRSARRLAHGLAHAATLNEPNMIGKVAALLPQGLLAGDRANAAAAARATGSARFQAGNALWVEDVAKTQANLIAAHRAGRAAIKAVRPDLPVGATLAIVDDQAVGDPGPRDAIRRRFYADWLEAVRGDDFVGVQNYLRSRWGAQGKLPPIPGARLNADGQEVWAGSLAGAVRYAHQASGCPVLVTEHGVVTDDDRLRCWLIPAALEELHGAMQDGVPVLGYIHWSLIDNYEWGFGYRPHFGLHSFDHATFARTAKSSATILGEISRTNGIAQSATASLYAQ